MAFFYLDYLNVCISMSRFINTVVAEQFLVGALFGHLAVIQYNDQVRILNGAQAVGNHQEVRFFIRLFSASVPFSLIPYPGRKWPRPAASDGGLRVRRVQCRYAAVVRRRAWTLYPRYWCYNRLRFCLIKSCALAILAAASTSSMVASGLAKATIIEDGVIEEDGLPVYYAHECPVKIPL